MMRQQSIRTLLDFAKAGCAEQAEKNADSDASTDVSDTSSYILYRRVYYEVVDRILSELSKHFDHSGTVLKAIAACSPKSSHFFDTEEVKPLAVQYGIDVDLLLPQLAVAKTK